MREGTPALVLDGILAQRHGAAALERRQRARLAAMVEYARACSPFYRELYRALPERVEDSSGLPVTDKRTLTERFDDWVTDPRVTHSSAVAFVSDPGLVGDRFLQAYTLATTSGTTGRPGIFVLDARSFAVAAAMGVRMLGSWLRARDVLRIALRGARLAMVGASGGHFATAIAAARLRRRAGRRIAALSAGAPLPELVARLNAFRPAVLAPYASVAALLAGEQEAGRLRIDPLLVVLAAEGLPAADRRRVERAFGAFVGESYAATECPFLTSSCREGWLHLNSDWAVLEAVDAEYRPVPAGTVSHTALLSNLANRVQPILRYDLGDRVVFRPEPCACGSPRSALRVQGRAADLLTLRTSGGTSVRIPGLALELDHLTHLELVQIVQTGPSALRVRLVPAPGADPERAWTEVRATLERLLRDHGLDEVDLVRGSEPPEVAPGGKIRPVVPGGEA